MKTILITGATSGIGLETAKAFMRETARGGVRIISLSRSAEKIEMAKKVFKNQPIEFYECDVSDFESVVSVAKEIEKKYGEIDTLVNNAGTIISGTLETLSGNNWDKTIRNNLSPYFYVSKAFLPLLKKSDYASIINISSVSGKSGSSSVAYACAKAGVDHFSRIIAGELAKYKIRVNTVSPGMINSGIHVHNGVMSQEQYDKMLEAAAPNYPLGIGECSDPAGAIVFLAGENARWITGADIVVDGGKLVKF